MRQHKRDVHTLFHILRVGRRVERAALALLALILICGPVAMADHGKVDRRVVDRMQSMHEQGTAIEALADMTNILSDYDARRARQLKSELAKEARRTKSLFRKIRFDPHARARPEVWIKWDSFVQMADNTTRTVRQLDTRNRVALARTHPPGSGFMPRLSPAVQRPGLDPTALTRTRPVQHCHRHPDQG